MFADNPGPFSRQLESPKIKQKMFHCLVPILSKSSETVRAFALLVTIIQNVVVCLFLLFQ